MVLLRNGDVLEGVLTALDERTIGIEVDKKPVTVDVSRTAAVALSSDLTEAPRPKGVYGRVILARTAPVCRWRRPSCADGATLTGTTLFGADVERSPGGRGRTRPLPGQGGLPF